MPMIWESMTRAATTEQKAWASEDWTTGSRADKAAKVDIAAPARQLVC